MNEQDRELVEKSRQLEEALRERVLEGMDAGQVMVFGMWAAMRIRRAVLEGEPGEGEARRVLGELVGMAEGMTG